MTNALGKIAFTLVAAGFLFCSGQNPLQAQPSKLQQQFNRTPNSAPFAGTNGKTSSLLSRGNIQRDLELTDEQIQKLTEIRKAQDTKLRDMMTNFRDTAKEQTPEERREFYRDMSVKRKAAAEETEEKVAEILLPFQTKRLDQIKIQYQIKSVRKGAGSSILHPAIKEHLDIDKEQEDRIRAKIAEVQKDLEEKIAELTKKANEEVFDELTSSQQDTYKELIGDELETDRAPRQYTDQDK